MLLPLFAWLFLLLVAFYLLARVSDEYFISSLEAISKRFRLSHDMAGATLMAIGSSAPEFFVCLVAILKPGGYAEVGVGTIVGSAIFNILVIVGVSAAVKETVVSWQPVVRDFLFYSLSIVLLLFFFQSGSIGFVESLIFVVTYLVYLGAVFFWRRFFPYEDDEEVHIEEFFQYEKRKGWEKVYIPFDLFLEKSFPVKEAFVKTFFLSVLYIGLLSWVLVESAVGIAHLLKVPEVIIALTILAVGTSIPDLISSYFVAKKGKGAMAISNAVGSNIFDILIGLGLPWMIYLGFLSGGEEIVVSTEGLYFSIFLLFATLLITFLLLILRRWKMDYKNGYPLILLYLIYLGWSLFQVV